MFTKYNSEINPGSAGEGASFGPWFSSLLTRHYCENLMCKFATIHLEPRGGVNNPTW